jgi:hypothetical protein
MLGYRRLKRALGLRVNGDIAGNLAELEPGTCGYVEGIPFGFVGWHIAHDGLWGG